MERTVQALSLVMTVMLALTILIMVEPTNAQTATPTLEWNRTYSPNTGFSLDQTSDNGYIIAGVNKTGFHDSLSFSTIVVKTNALGETEWTKEFGDKFAGPLFPICITQASDSGFILSTPINELIKMDSLGKIEWNVQAICGKVVQVYDGYIVAGFSLDSYGTHFSNITKVDSYGKILWIRSFDNGFHGNVAFRALTKTIDNKIAVVGNWNSYFWLGILDINGNFLVNKTYPSYGSSNIFSGIANTNDNGFVLCGQNGNATAVLYKVDSQGNLEWNNSYSPSSFNSVAQTFDKEYLAGTNTGILVKAKANGYQEFSANYSRGIFGIIPTSNRGFAVTGTLDDRLWLAKFTLQGNSSPSPTIPELSWLIIVPLLFSVLFVAIILRHRKTTNLNK